MNTLCQAALSVLDRVYDRDTALFPFTTRLVDGELRSVFSHPRTMRSTINCLLGLQEASKSGGDHPLLVDSGRLVERFVHRHEGDVGNPGDLGLLTVLLSDGAHDRGAIGRIVGRIDDRTSVPRDLRGVNVQDLSWMLWGSVCATRRGVPGAERVAGRLLAALGAHVPPGSMLPCHSVRIGRRDIVSFGACVYFLRAAYEYGTAFDDAAAMQLFRQGTGALLRSQGPSGEWPWLYRPRDARPVELYPLFTVHQHSMAMLFVLPAAAEGVVADVEEVVASSLSWVAGSNQLGVSMLRRDPFFIYRSIERRGRWPRAERYVRARVVAAAGREAAPAPNERVMVNAESRSYELGWLLYVLSDRSKLAGID